jgi:hypothetical protein
MRKAVIDKGKAPGSVKIIPSMEPVLIAPCGINCALCSGYRRKKDPCSGCNGSGYKPRYCASCPIRFCEEKSGGESEFCGNCQKYPCKRLKQLEKRYRTKYGVNIFENLSRIEENGIEAFLADETRRWICARCGTILCMHKDLCTTCGAENPNYLWKKD